MDRRELLTQAFQDTQAFYRENEVLAQAAETSRRDTVIYGPEDYPPLPTEPRRTLREGEVTVSRRRTFEAAMEIRKRNPGAKIAVLNFASATNPGGGVRRGSSAQEECLCRCSTLYPALDQKRMWDGFYAPNRAARDPLHTDAILYTPGVVICKSDEDIPKRLRPEEFVTVDVLTCAAPDLRPPRDGGSPVKVSDGELSRLHLRRAKHILHVAAAHSIDALVLGAFGCGAFRNRPDLVADALFQALEPYRHRFDLVEFAVYCRDSDTENFEVFKRYRGIYDYGAVSILPPGAEARRQYGEAYGSVIVPLTQRQLDALNAGGQLAVDILAEYVVFLQGPGKGTPPA